MKGKARKFSKKVITAKQGSDAIGQQQIGHHTTSVHALATPFRASASLFTGYDCLFVGFDCPTVGHDRLSPCNDCLFDGFASLSHDFAASTPGVASRSMRYPLPSALADGYENQHQRVIANAVKQSHIRTDCFVVPPRNDGDSGVRTDCFGFVPQPRNDG